MVSRYLLRQPRELEQVVWNRASASGRTMAAVASGLGTGPYYCPWDGLPESTQAALRDYLRRELPR